MVFSFNGKRRATLLRQATFDLTGLPPTATEVKSFQKIPHQMRIRSYSIGSFRALVIGERMASDWLDIARYSDSYGFQRDTPRPTMWPWRDWVINPSTTIFPGTILCSGN